MSESPTANRPDAGAAADLLEAAADQLDQPDATGQGRAAAQYLRRVAGDLRREWLLPDCEDVCCQEAAAALKVARTILETRSAVVDVTTPTWTPKPGKVLALRTCETGDDGALTGHGGFAWPSTVGAEVVAPDWDPRPCCGKGLHGLLWGTGDPTYLNRNVPAYMVVEADEADVVWISDDKVKFPRCVIVYVGDLGTAARILSEHAPDTGGRRAQVAALSEHSHRTYVLDTQRKRPACAYGCDGDDYDDCDHVARAEVVPVPLGPLANIISSEIDRAPRPGDGNPTGEPMHTVMLDLDVEARLLPSSTPGHYHLYIDVPMPWRKYKRLLKTLAHVGIIEPGYYRAAAQRQATFLRLPWIRKPAKVAPEMDTPAWGDL